MSNFLLSELIDILCKARDEHGDLPVYRMNDDGLLDIESTADNFRFYAFIINGDQKIKDGTKIYVL